MIQMKGEMKVTAVYSNRGGRIQGDGTYWSAFGVTNGRMSHQVEFPAPEQAEAERERYLKAGAVPV